ncbi:unnamed protein product [Linum trigynum]|uniref:Uncharacterized protein n=1 Tax=Linum trigynum TaxID=586398 RepID=A0AAV2G7U5_9ROSI
MLLALHSRHCSEISIGRKVYHHHGVSFKAFGKVLFNLIWCESMMGHAFNTSRISSKHYRKSLIPSAEKVISSLSSFLFHGGKYSSMNACERVSHVVMVHGGWYPSHCFAPPPSENAKSRCRIPSLVAASPGMESTISKNVFKCFPQIRDTT